MKVLFSDGSRRAFKEVARELMRRFQEEDSRGFFLNPVPESVPLYYQIIQRPMDFGTMSKKIQKSRYKQLKDLRRDLLLVVYNCMLFNSDDSEFYHEAQRLEKVLVPLVDHARKYLKPEQVGYEVDKKGDEIDPKTKKKFVLEEKIKVEKLSSSKSQITNADNSKKKGEPPAKLKITLSSRPKSSQRRITIPKEPPKSIFKFGGKSYEDFLASVESERPSKRQKIRSRKSMESGDGSKHLTDAQRMSTKVQKLQDGVSPSTLPSSQDYSSKRFSTDSRSLYSQNLLTSPVAGEQAQWTGAIMSPDGEMQDEFSDSEDEREFYKHQRLPVTTAQEINTPILPSRLPLITSSLPEPIQAIHLSKRMTHRLERLSPQLITKFDKFFRRSDSLSDPELDESELSFVDLSEFYDRGLWLSRSVASSAENRFLPLLYNRLQDIDGLPIANRHHSRKLFEDFGRSSHCSMWTYQELSKLDGYDSLKTSEYGDDPYRIILTEKDKEIIRGLAVFGVDPQQIESYCANNFS